MEKNASEISSEVLVQKGVVPVLTAKEVADFTVPSPEAIHVIPPLFIDKDDLQNEESVITLSSRIQTVALPPDREPKVKTRRFCGIKIPCKYKDLSIPRIILTIILSDRALCFIFSLFFHLALFVILALLVFQTRTGTMGEAIDAGFTEEGETLETVETVGDDLLSEVTLETVPDKKREEQVVPETVIESFTKNMETNVDRISESILAKTPENIVSKVETPGGGIPLLTRSGLTKGRTQENRKNGLPGRTGDTTNASEEAVERGLAWLAEHQLPDGGWAFNLNAKDANGRLGTCNGQCSNTFQGLHHNTSYRTGLHPSRTAATALALLPFLGAGYTHLSKNRYQKAIYSGLEFLKYHSVHADNGYDFREDCIAQGMYIQGIVVLTLCEAWEMTGDKTLKSYAQEGIRFIEKAQRNDGGWRYHTPKDTDFFKDVSSDTTVTGWQVMALKSGISAGLEVKPSVVYMVDNYLRLVQNDEGSLYYYLPIKNESGIDKMWATTAVGLLIRQYMGWRPDHPGLKRGIAYLREWLAQADKDWTLVKKGEYKNGKRDLLVGFGETSRKLFVHNIYFTFYSMLVLHNQGGSDWLSSFAKVREFLIENQIKTGHENGSWLFHDLYMNDGGRLLNTSLAILVLETPYRYLPLYQDKTKIK